MNYDFCIIFGTRPEYLKIKPIINQFNLQSFLTFKIIYVTQHENINEEFNDNILKLKINDSSSNVRLSNIGSEILLKLPDLISDCSNIIVQGDTSTAFYSALVGFQMNKKIIHIEAGLRTYDIFKPFPEESYRQMISRLTTIHFTPHNDCSDILKNEKVAGNIVCVGNTILDLINSYNLNCTMENIVLITFHRRENWNKIDELLTGLKKLIKKTPHLNYLWYLHMNPNLQEKVKNAISNMSSINLKEPCSHIEFAKYMSKCNFIITDSGGIQEEASFLGKHSIVLRKSTERTHIPKEYITIVENYSELDVEYENIPKTHLPSCNIYGKGNSSAKIINYLRDNYKQ